MSCATYTIYNRNYAGFDYVRIHSELLKSVPRLKFFAKFVRNCFYTKPLATIAKSLKRNQFVNKINQIFIKYYAEFTLPIFYSNGIFYSIGISTQTEFPLKRNFLLKRNFHSNGISLKRNFLLKRNWKKLAD